MLRGDGQALFDVPGESFDAGVVLFLYINFSVSGRDIRGYIAMLMDLPSLDALKSLIGEFIERVMSLDGVAGPV